MSLRHSARPDELAAALAAADTSILAMVYVQLTGDETLLAEISPYIKGPWDYNTEFPPELEEKLRQHLMVLLRDRPAGPPVIPAAALIKKMMSVCVGQPVPDEYVPMMLEEMALTGDEIKNVAWRKNLPAEALRNFHVAVIGAGMSGICTAIKLKQAGIPFVVYEKNRTVGGTWFENKYPGCGVDTPNHFYSFSFEPNHDWPHYFSKRNELHNYLERCADKYGIRDSIRFNTEVVSARFDEVAARWRLTVRSANGESEVSDANAIVFAVGQLNRPLIPNIAGLDDFAGRVVHTAQWPDDLDVESKRVALIGTGASGMQVGPAIAGKVQRLAIFQRSPHWAAFSPNYHRSVEEGKKWALKNVPFYANWYRFQLFWASADGLHPILKVDPQWPRPEQSLNQANEKQRQALIAHIRKEVGDNPALLEKIIPPYPPYGRRMLRDNHWYKMLTRDNVDLVVEGIERITPGAVIARDGNEYPADLIVLATGFRAAEQLAPVDIRGRNGRSIRDVWGDDDPRAYLGITVPGFPNMFIMYGPNTNLAHGGSAIFHTECQVRYTLQGLRELIEAGRGSMECKQDVHDAYNLRVDQAHSQMVWAHKGVNSWYKNARGRVTQTTPWRMVDYWRWTSELNRDDYIWR